MHCAIMDFKITQKKAGIPMKRFELWLDESGEFDNDRQKVRRGMSVSHIGGLFV